MISVTSLKKAKGERYSGDAGFPFPHYDFMFLTVYVKSVDREWANDVVAVRIRREKRMNRKCLQKTVTLCSRQE